VYILYDSEGGLTVCKDKEQVNQAIGDLLLLDVAVHKVVKKDKGYVSINRPNLIHDKSYYDIDVTTGWVEDLD
jgi:hypothetical protein